MREETAGPCVLGGSAACLCKHAGPRSGGSCVKESRPAAVGSGPLGLTIGPDS